MSSRDAPGPPASGGADPNDPLQRGESEDEPDGPDQQQARERQRTVNGEKPFASAIVLDRARDAAPRQPRAAEIQAGEPQSARDGPRQDDGFERVPKNRGNENKAGDE